ncbi:hypothetical protein WN51_12546 [Melipona quadrifasciata]|uniref:Uncharacterized protein n=1 Tax=Melipona quadrifasciata TaxID=166423 RepID=A0A0N0U638_9HYME|nr:hypothetical protein WN51_12546 [Melipona quadrifasciata]
MTNYKFWLDLVRNVRNTSIDSFLLEDRFYPAVIRHTLLFSSTIHSEPEFINKQLFNQRRKTEKLSTITLLECFRLVEYPHSCDSKSIPIGWSHFVEFNYYLEEVRVCGNTARMGVGPALAVCGNTARMGAGPALAEWDKDEIPEVAFRVTNSRYRIETGSTSSVGRLVDKCQIPLSRQGPTSSKGSSERKLYREDRERTHKYKYNTNSSVVQFIGTEVEGANNSDRHDQRGRGHFTAMTE